MTQTSKQNIFTDIRYAPPAGYDLDLEILPASALKQKISAKKTQPTERIEFYMLIYVTEGHCKHWVDFDLLDCAPGTLLIFQPGQVHRFDFTNDWQGWLLLYRSEFRQPKPSSLPSSELEIFQYLQDLPVLLKLSESERQLVTASIMTMYEDTKRQADRVVLHALLRSQLYTLLIRLFLIHSHRPQPGIASRLVLSQY